MEMQLSYRIPIGFLRFRDGDSAFFAPLAADFGPDPEEVADAHATERGASFSAPLVVSEGHTTGQGIHTSAPLATNFWLGPVAVVEAGADLDVAVTGGRQWSRGCGE